MLPGFFLAPAKVFPSGRQHRPRSDAGEGRQAEQSACREGAGAAPELHCDKRHREQSSKQP